jgi:iron complex transport system ATP-binding protein
MLKINNLKVALGKKNILDNISFTDSSNIIGITGNNGVGKSTLLKAILGSIKYSGDIYYNNKDIRSYSHRNLANVISYMPQSISFSNSSLNVEQFLILSRFPHTIFRKIKADNLLNFICEYFNVSNLRKQTIATLSGGEVKRVLFASAIFQEAKLLLLDEPTSGLDIFNAKKTILSILEPDLKHLIPNTVVIVSHDLSLLNSICSSLYVLTDNDLIHLGNPVEIEIAKVFSSIFNCKIEHYIGQDTGESLFIPNFLNVN